MSATDSLFDDAPRKPGISISVHGEGATIETAFEVAELSKDILASVGQAMGVPEGALEWRIASVQFQCDGCGLKRPDKPKPDEGWSFADGDDFCPACTKARRNG